MLGPAKLRRLNQVIAVSLEDIVPPDHFYRHLEAKLDLSFVRAWVQELYAERGTHHRGGDHLDAAQTSAHRADTLRHLRRDDLVRSPRRERNARQRARSCGGPWTGHADSRIGSGDALERT